MTRSRPLVAAIAVIGAMTLAVTLGYIGGRVSRPHRTVPVSADTFAVTWSPLAVEGKAAYLAAGGSGGGAAITYLKFNVDLRGGTAPTRADLWLARHSGPLPEMVELTHVPSTIWDEANLTATSAPRLGAVVGSIAPRGYESALRFDVTKVIRRTGTYAFAVTAPTSGSIARFIARDDLMAAKGPTITFSFDSPTGLAPSTPPYATPDVSPSGLIATDEPMSPTAPPWPLETPSPIATELPGVPPPTLSADPVPSLTPTESPAPADPTPVGSEPAVPTPGDPTPADPPSMGPTPAGSEPAAPTPGDLSPSGSTPADPPPARPEPPVPVITPGDPSPPVTPGDPSPSVIPGEPSPSVTPGDPSPSPTPGEPDCEVGNTLVPTCGVMWGVAPAGHTEVARNEAIADFEATTGRQQALFHAYHRGNQIFPTDEEMAIARNAGNPRVLFLNWKPASYTWEELADGDADSYLDRLAAHITANFPERFFFTMNHEPEDDVKSFPGSGMTAMDFANAFRHVVLYLRERGVTNMVTAVCYMAYVPWNSKGWFEDLYPGDDVVDWVAWDAYAYSEPGYGHGDFAEMMNRRSGSRAGWPGFYNWAATRFPSKPLMVAEWGVWYSDRNPEHQAYFFESVAKQMELFPRVKAMMYFDTPSQQQGRDSRVNVTETGLMAYRRLGQSPVFSVMPEANLPAPGY